MVHFSIPRCKATLKIYNTFKELILLCFYSPSVCKEKKDISTFILIMLKTKYGNHRL